VGKRPKSLIGSLLNCVSDMDVTLLTLLIFIAIAIVGAFGTWLLGKTISDSDPFKEDGSNDHGNTAAQH
jgi:hypothetical protein